MGTKHIENNTPNTIYVGGRMIAPGEGRDIDERDLPPEHRDAPVVVVDARPSLDDELAALLKGSVKEVAATLGALTHEALDRLAEIERTYAHPRKTLLEAIGDEKLRRANEALTSDDLDADTVAGADGSDTVAGDDAGGDDVNAGV